MTDSRLIAYVAEARKKGMTDGQIREGLSQVGWRTSEIDKVLHVDSNGIAVPGHAVNTCAPSISRNIPTIVATLLFVILGLAGGVGFLWNKQIDLTDKNSVAVKDFFVHLAEGQVGFVDAASLVYPDDQKFFNAKQEYIQQKKDFVEADLDTMHLRLYQGGVVAKEFKIIAKGKDGSWWETPTGDYRALKKETNHFSSIGKVWMPWSIQFYGNFFIHGWPYYDNGEPVPAGHSGGCIRLSTGDAKDLYQYVSEGTPVLVKESTLSRGFGSAIAQGGQPPVVSANSFLIANVSTGETLIEKTDGSAAPIASLTKLMTAVVASELIYLERSISVNNDMMASVGSRFEPQVGDKYIAFDLLYPLLMQSSNQAANIIAGFLGRNNFIQDMNKKAVSLGMIDTHFEDVSGIGSGNTSSPKDLLKLLQYIYFKRSFLFEITRGMPYTTYSGLHTTELANFNELVSDPRLVGTKNGKTTAAGETLASVWEFPSPNGPVPVAIILLGSKNRVVDEKALLGWVESTVKFR